MVFFNKKESIEYTKEVNIFLLGIYRKNRD